MRKIFLIFFVVAFANSDVLNKILQTQIKQEEDRLKALQTNKNKANIIFDTQENESKTILNNEKPCFNIDKIVLINNDNKFKKELNKALNKVKFKPNSCLGEKNIAIIYETLSNEIISSGYITTSVFIPQQNLKRGVLEFEILQGKIDKITINDTNSTKNRASEFMAFGGNKNSDILNIRDVEQAVENIQNATNGSVSVELIPSDKSNFSDINITKNEKLPLSLWLSFDNLGSNATGKYQANANLYAYNLMGFNEIFYASYSANLFSGDKQSIENESKIGRYDNVYYGASVPFGRFLLDFNEYRYSYDLAVAGAYSVYKYSGESKRRNLTLSYLYHRNQISKNSMFFRLWERENKNYIDEFELDNQRRKTAGYEIGLDSQLFIENGLVAIGASYKKATGAMGSLKAPEEEYGEWTSRFEIISAYLNFRKQSHIKPLTYDFKFSGMWNLTPLTMHEKLNLGGYYSVRGFDGKMSIAGDKGYYARNTLEYQIFNNHSIYTAFDVGKVSKRSNDSSSNNILIGSGIGLKGGFNVYGALSYDLFFGFPIKKPDFFKTSDISTNFTISYHF